MKLILFFSWIIWPQGVINHTLMPEGSTHIYTSAQDFPGVSGKGLLGGAVCRFFEAKCNYALTGHLPDKFVLNLCSS